MIRRRPETKGFTKGTARGVLALLVALAGLAVTAPFATSAGAATGGSLSVQPGRGPVGTSVTISGINCASSAGAVALEFQGLQDAGTRGSVSLLDVRPAADGRFSVNFVIPPSLGQAQGDAAGPTAPGRYQFTSHVPGCTAAFTVAPGLAGAAAVSARLPATGGPTASLALLGSGLVLLGVAGRMAGGSRRRSGAARSA